MRLLVAPSADRSIAESDGLDRNGLAALYTGPRPAPTGRPWVGLCMISSLDGSTVVDGRSGALGNDGDRTVFAALRSVADVILVGATTVAAERYRAPQRSGQRIGVVTASGRVDLGTDLFHSGAGFLVMADDSPHVAGVDVVRAGSGRVDMGVAIARLGDVVDTPRVVQAEGGATLNGALIDAGCVDELDLTIAPIIVGGDGPRIVRGAAPAARGYSLAHLVVDDDGYLFSRWLRGDPATGPRDER